MKWLNQYGGNRLNDGKILALIAYPIPVEITNRDESRGSSWTAKLWRLEEKAPIGKTSQDPDDPIEHKNIPASPFKLTVLGPNLLEILDILKEEFRPLTMSQSGGKREGAYQGCCRSCDIHF